jgi:hypothetical protein
MQLRSGNIYSHTSIRRKITITEIKYRGFKIHCGDFIGELNDTTCNVDTVCVLFRMYSYICSEIDNISSYLNLHPGLKSFLICLVNNIPKHIQDIISCERDDEMGTTWRELTGFTAIEIARMLYELRLNVREILDVFDN